jgi:hypothetical protein
MHLFVYLLNQSGAALCNRWFLRNGCSIT